MAEKNLTESVPNQENITEICRSANFEIWQLAKVLKQMMAEIDMTWEGDLAARGMLMRIQALTDIVYGGLLNPPDERLPEAELMQMLGTEVRRA